MQEASCYPIPGRPLPPGCPPPPDPDADADPSASIDDGAEPDEDEEVAPSPTPHPYASMSDAEFTSKLKKNPSEFGPMSIGFPGQGRLYNGVQMPRGDQWNVVDPGHAWGTQETVDYLRGAILKVNQEFPGAPRVVIGHISAKLGGPLSPHISHQAGRDVDVGYYYQTELPYFARADARNLDLPRTWSFVKALLRDTRIDLILIDRSIQKLIRDYALSHNEDSTWIQQVFDGGQGKRALILHARGHGDHIHVRFFNPIAQETGRRAGPTLLHMGLLKPPQTAPPRGGACRVLHAQGVSRRNLGRHCQAIWRDRGADSRGQRDVEQPAAAEAGAEDSGQAADSQGKGASFFPGCALQAAGQRRALGTRRAERRTA